MEESKRHSPVSGFCCSERFERIHEDDVVPAVLFVCNLPPVSKEDEDIDHHHASNATLEFVCREPSCGALLPSETKVVIGEEAELPMDPNFFDQGYTLAGRTGFQVWTGTRIMIETLLWKDADKNANGKIQYWQKRIRDGANILELGAGVGVVGCCLAASGGNVLLTDLPTLVENSVQPNLKRNQTKITWQTDNALSESCPDWLKFQEENGVRIRKGWAATTAVDWKVPIDEQLSFEQSSHVDLIVASDCLFLVEMLEMLLSTVAAVFDRSTARQPALLLSFQRRDPKDGDESRSFTTVNRVITEVKARRWSIECLAWYPVVVAEDSTSEVFVFEILPSTSP